MNREVARLVMRLASLSTMPCDRGGLKVRGSFRSSGTRRGYRQVIVIGWIREEVNVASGVLSSLTENHGSSGGWNFNFRESD